MCRDFQAEMMGEKEKRAMIDSMIIFKKSLLGPYVLDSMRATLTGNTKTFARPPPFLAAGGVGTLSPKGEFVPDRGEATEEPAKEGVEDVEEEVLPGTDRLAGARSGGDLGRGFSLGVGVDPGLSRR